MRIVRRLLAAAVLTAAAFTVQSTDVSAHRSCIGAIEECQIFFGCDLVFFLCNPQTGECWVDCPCDLQESFVCDAP